MCLPAVFGMFAVTLPTPPRPTAPPSTALEVGAVRGRQGGRLEGASPGRLLPVTNAVGLGSWGKGSWVAGPAHGAGAQGPATTPGPRFAGASSRTDAEGWVRGAGVRPHPPLRTAHRMWAMTRTRRPVRSGTAVSLFAVWTVPHGGCGRADASGGGGGGCVMAPPSSSGLVAGGVRAMPEPPAVLPAVARRHRPCAREADQVPAAGGWPFNRRRFPPAVDAQPRRPLMVQRWPVDGR